MDLRLEPYGAMQILAIAVFLGFTEYGLRRRGASILARPWWIAAGVLAAGIGGRLHFAVEAILSGRAGAGATLSLLDPARAGSTFFGSMAGVLILLALARGRLPGGSALRFADTCVPGLAAAIFIGRFGCLLQGCCVGVESSLPWALPAGLNFVPGAARHEPLVLFLGAWAAASALLSDRVVTALGQAPGVRVLSFAMIFSAGRAGLETMRLVDASQAVRWAQIESIALALVSAGVLALVARKRERAPV